MGKRWGRRGGKNEERQKKFEIIEERTRTKKVERGRGRGTTFLLQIWSWEEPDGERQRWNCTGTVYI